MLREKAKGDFARVFKGTEKTRQRLSVVEELLTYWNIDEADDQLEELEEALITADFGPKTAFKVVDAIREDILAGAASRPMQTGRRPPLGALCYSWCLCSCNVPCAGRNAVPCATHGVHAEAAIPAHDLCLSQVT